MTCTVLIENSRGPVKGLHREHGLSVLVECPEGQLLFDTGSSGRFLDNAALMGYHLEETVHRVVLSHNHHDHTDGLPRLAESSVLSLDIHVGKDFFSPKYSVKDDGSLHFSGARCGSEDLTRGGHCVIEHTEACTEIMEDVFLLTSFSSGRTNPRFVISRDGSMVPDPFMDESVLVLKRPEGMVVLTGCSHPGILTILETVGAHFDRPVIACLGGTHLMDSAGEELDRVVNALCRSSIQLLGCSHCTGAEAEALLTSRSKGYVPFHTGDSYTFA